MLYTISKVFAITFFMTFTPLFYAFSQEVFIENGVVMSTLKKNFTSFETKYQVGLGINYLDKDFFFLTSGINYIRKGNEVTFLENENEYLSRIVSNKYISLNTVFNLKKDIYNTVFYIGAGPRIDFGVNNKIDSNLSNNILWGLKCNLGVNIHITDWMVGVNFSYLPSFTNFQSDLNLKDKTLTFGVLIGKSF